MNRNTYCYHMKSNPRLRQRGLSLVEIMVSMAIGLVVVGAVFANFLNSTAGAKQSAALAQVTEDATLALGILRNHITMADYSQPTGVDGMTGMLARRLDKQLNLLGCDGGFDTSTDAKANPNDVRCATKPGDSDALLVRYEADSDTLPTSTNSKTNVAGPMDCQGSAIPHINGDTYFVADNRFFVDASKTPPTLSCIGSGKQTDDGTDFNGSSPLVENIQEMHLRFGVASQDAKTGRPLNVFQYVKAEEVGKPDGTSANYREAWRQVVSVRICVVVSSVDNVLDAARPYRNCAGDVITPTSSDRHIYRAFTSTVVLNNRVLTPASTQ